MATVYQCTVNTLDNPAQCAELYAITLLRLYQVYTMKYPILQLVTKSGQRLGHEALLQYKEFYTYSFLGGLLKPCLPKLMY